MKKDCRLSLRQESNQISKYRGYDERQQPMLMVCIFAIYTNGLGIKNATVFDIIVVTLGVSHCKYTLNFHNRNKFGDFIAWPEALHNLQRGQLN